MAKWPPPQVAVRFQRSSHGAAFLSSSADGSEQSVSTKPKDPGSREAVVSLNTDSSIRQTHSLSCLTNDAHKAFLSHSLPSCPALLCLLHPYFCKQTRPRFCTLDRKKKSIAVEQKPMGSARNMLLAPSASCYYGNNEGFL